MAEPKWYRRYGDVPGVDYTTPPGTRTPKGAEAIPRVAYEGENGYVSLSWSDGAVESSSSPVHERAFSTDFGEKTTDQALRHLAATLELPGEPIDYHFAIQHVLSALWARRRTEPAALDHVERLAWMDVRLIEAEPTVAEVGYGREGYLRILAFGHLVTVYEREGSLADALRVATIAARFDQLTEQREALAERVAQLEAEPSP
jgi:hypothetical protein